MNIGNMVFADNLRRLMAEKGITQKQLSDQIGVSTGSVSIWCNGGAVPRPRTMLVLLEYFGVDYWALFGDEHNEKQKETDKEARTFRFCPYCGAELKGEE